MRHPTASWSVRRNAGVLYVTLLLVIAVDQVSKVLVPARVLNRGISFGVAAGWGGLPALSAVLLVALLLWLSLVAWRSQWPWWCWSAIGLIIGGGTSNVLDRFLSGAVRDPLRVPFTTLHNNVADYAIFIGVFLILITVLTHREEESNAHQASA